MLTERERPEGIRNKMRRMFAGKKRAAWKRVFSGKGLHRKGRRAAALTAVLLILGSLGGDVVAKNSLLWAEASSGVEPVISTASDAWVLRSEEAVIENRSVVSSADAAPLATPSNLPFDSTFLFKKATDSAPQRNPMIQDGPGISLLSTGNDDSSFSAKNFTSTVKDLKLSVTRKGERHFVFTITGKVLRPYVMTDIGYYYVWGAYLGFMTYGNEPKPGIGKTLPNGRDPFQYYLNPEIKDKVRDEGKTSYHYRYMNQSHVYSLGDGLMKGTVITAELAPKHSYANDGCRSTQETIGKIVSVTHNVPEIADKKTDMFDLVMHIEVSELSDAVTGIYTGAYQRNYYSGSNPNERWIYCRDMIDGSEQLQAAREGRVMLDFDPGEGSGGPGSIELMAGSSYTPPDPVPPFGKHFAEWKGWNGIVPNAAASYQAVYEENVYHVLLYTAGGSPAETFQDVPYSAVKHRFPLIPKKGYTLKYWRLQGD